MCVGSVGRSGGRCRMSNHLNNSAPDDFGAAVDRIRKIAAEAAHSGAVSEAPRHPDAELLALCAKVIDLRAEERALARETRNIKSLYITNPKFAAEIEKRGIVEAARRSPMMLIPKIPAKTAAGIYAKATVLRLSHGTAPRLAQSLAEDLTTCPGLRKVLWPAGEGK